MEQQIILEPFVSPEERTKLLRFCMKFTGDKDIAEDLVQETLVEAWKHLHTLREPARHTQWLFGIARNICLRWTRSQKKDRTHRLDLPGDQDLQAAELEDLLADDFDIEVELERRELITLLDRALALLPAETRTVLIKRYVEESPLQEVATQLGLNVSAVAMRLQRGKLAMRHVLTTDLQQEIAPYTTTSVTGQWEETPLWCYLCGQRHLQGIRRPEKGQLLLRCPACNSAPTEVLSYNEMPLLQGVKGYKPLFSRLKNWCAHYYWTGLLRGTIPCEGCGRELPVRIIKEDNLPDWVRINDREMPWVYHHNDHLVAITCETCRASYRSVLELLVLDLPASQQFLQNHPRIRTLPGYELEVEGRRALVSRFESITDTATLTVISDYETYQTMRIEGSIR